MQVRTHGCVFVRIQHHRGQVVAREAGQRLGFGRVEQQMIAAHVATACRGVFAPVRAVGIGARNNHHINAFQQRLQQTLRQLAGNYQHGFAGGRFVAVLLAYQQHGGPACRLQCGGVGARAACQNQRFQRLALL